MNTSQHPGLPTASEVDPIAGIVLLEDELLGHVVGGFGPNGGWTDCGPNGGWTD